MNKGYKRLQEYFKDRIQTDILLAPYTTYKIGGPADLFLEARTKDELVDGVVRARALDIPVFILGGGTNILIGDNGVRGLVIRNLTSTLVVKGMKGVLHSGEHDVRTVYVEADTGVPFNRLVRFTLDEGLSGLEMHLGLPGSVGGAVAMNSKWMHPPGYVGDAVYQADILTVKNERKRVDADYFRFSYGKSAIPKTGDIILSVIFALTKRTKEAVWDIANKSIEYRRTTQPQGVRTAGCAFKNISQSDALVAATPNGTTSAGFLLDKSGCKPLRVGDAMVSPVHANFIVNAGHAKASDVVQLLGQMKRNVKKTFGVTLKEEIQLVGEF